MVIKIEKISDKEIILKTDSTTFNIKEIEDGELAIDTQFNSTTTVCWKGTLYNEMFTLEGVNLHLRKGKLLREYYELDNLY